MPLVLPASFLLKSVSASLCECVCVWDGSEFSARGLTFAACSGVSCSQQSLSNPTQTKPNPSSSSGRLSFFSCGFRSRIAFNAGTGRKEMPCRR